MVRSLADRTFQLCFGRRLPPETSGGAAKAQALRAPNSLSTGPTGSSTSFLFFYRATGWRWTQKRPNTNRWCLAVKRILSISTLKHSPEKSKREKRENNEHLESFGYENTSKINVKKHDGFVFDTPLEGAASRSRSFKKKVGFKICCSRILDDGVIFLVGSSAVRCSGPMENFPPR